MQIKFPKSVLASICFILLFINAKCSDDDEAESSCGPMAVIDAGFYDASESDAYNLMSAEIMGNCLTVEISAGGCDGSTWSLVLVDSGAIAESIPAKRSLKLVFSNLEDCEAQITQTRVFDLRNIQIEGSSAVILNFQNLDEVLRYDY